MKAARWFGRDDIAVVDIAPPIPTPEQALLRVLWCGVCGSDLEEYRNGPLTIPVTQPHPGSGRVAPITLGHEIVAVVEQAAAGGSGFPAGTVVIPDVVIGCGACWWCNRHDEGLCPRLTVLGQHDDGGLSEYMVARADRCIPVPPSLEPAHAALAEPTAVAVRALRKAPRVVGSTVLILGGGTTGLIIAQIVRSHGAHAVFVVDVRADRLAIAEHFGVSPVHADELPALLAALPEPGIDTVLECTGSPGLLNQALRAVRPGGTVIVVGLHGGDGPVDIPALVIGERRILGTAAHMYDDDVHTAVQLLATRTVDPEPLITHRIPLGDVATVGLPLLADPTAGAVKVLVRCSDTTGPETGEHP
ncbi:zinc-dependent alcohol dehydrogenase [Rhodococcus marinonascens]|uniref:zinc-dependent alcohol dehydrogenase n=1 Tax=Rhodococcus marinonascens TaxID=38311 RepID=UPI0009352E26|nr:alcohol dehydrogenase catalytic domain-containing protein [Rhodococcus marinonascens]